MLRSIKDWLLVGLLLLDEVAALVLVLLVLWFFKIRISFEIVIVIALLLGTFVFITHKVIIPSFHKRKVTGSEGMVGLVGEVIEPLAPVGIVRVEGELWKAKSVDEDIAAGEDVEILRLKRLTLEVKRKDR
ncbi:MAG: NfeD family protein [Dehalococcoidales bacterium]